MNMGSKKSRPRISFVGMNAEEVTGSMVLIEMENTKILLETGLFQSNNIKKDYEINTRQFKFRPRDIDFIFIGHTHIDHIGLLPRLFAEGCKAEVIVVDDTPVFSSILLKDSAFIMQRDVEALSRMTGKTLKPIYNSEDVDNAMAHMVEYPFNTKVTLNDEVSFEFIPAGHIIRSAQIKLWLKHGNHTSKILYTSDLGNIKLDKPYVEEFEAETKANIVIGECTYASKDRSVGLKDRQKDIEKIKTVVQDVCFERKGRVLIPTFSLDRTQFMLTLLYDLFGHDPNFNIPIVIDSPLSVKITNGYQEVLAKEQLAKLNAALHWKNVRMIKESDDSKACVADLSPKIILSASGMMVSGRSRHYIKTILPDSRSMVLFCGFATPGSLAGKIKDGRTQKTITIDGKPYGNKCGIVDLKSFSSHMQHDDLLNYYSDINCEKICLVHGNFKDKLEFAKELQDTISEKNKTSRVVVVNKSTEILL